MLFVIKKCVSEKGGKKPYQKLCQKNLSKNYLQLTNICDRLII